MVGVGHNILAKYRLVSGENGRVRLDRSTLGTSLETRTLGGCRGNVKEGLYHGC